MAENTQNESPSDFYFRATLRPGSPDLASFDKDGGLHLLPPGEGLLREWQSALNWEPSIPFPAICISPREFTGVIPMAEEGRLSPRNLLVAVFETMDGGGLLNWEVEGISILPVEKQRIPTVKHFLASYAKRLYWSGTSFRPGRIYSGLKSRVLPATTTWSCIGNPTLLDFPFLRLMAMPQPKLMGYFRDQIREHVAAAVEGQILVSAFATPPEKEAMREVLKFSDTRVIRMLPHGIPLEYRLSPFEAKLVSAGRLLLLSGYPPHVLPRSPDAGMLNQTLSWGRQIVAASER